MLTFCRMREAAFFGDRDKIAELMNFHRATLRCERRFVEVAGLFRGPFRSYPLDIYPLRIYTRIMANKKANVPLTPAVLHILLALSTKERHGYGIMKEVEADSEGKVKMGPGTLYGSLGRMIEAGLIRENEKKRDPEMDDERRVYYKITSLGQHALAAELERYREVVAVATRNTLSPNTHAYGI